MVSVNKVGGVKLQEAEFDAARSSLEMGTVARARFYPTLASRFDFWPVATAMGQSAIIEVAFDAGERPKSPDTLVDIVGKSLGAGALSSAFPGQPRCSARTLTPREQCTPATACAAEFRIKVEAECDPERERHHLSPIVSPVATPTLARCGSYGVQSRRNVPVARCHRRSGRRWHSHRAPRPHRKSRTL